MTSLPSQFFATMRALPLNQPKKAKVAKKTSALNLNFAPV